MISILDQKPILYILPESVTWKDWFPELSYDSDRFMVEEICLEPDLDTALDTQWPIDVAHR